MTGGVLARGVMAVALLGLAGCGGGSGAGVVRGGVCTGPDVLAYQGAEVVVMTAGCPDLPSRPATPEDLARLQAPL